MHHSLRLSRLVLFCFLKLRASKTCSKQLKLTVQSVDSHVSWKKTIHNEHGIRSISFFRGRPNEHLQLKLWEHVFFMKKICGSSPRTLHQPLAALGSRLGFSTTCCTPGYPPRMIVPFDHQPVILGVLEINLESNAEVVPEVGLQDIYSIYIYI